MAQLKNTSASFILLTAPGIAPCAVPPFNRPRGQVDPLTPAEKALADKGLDPQSINVIECSDARLEAYHAEMVGPPGKQISQIDYFARRGLEIL